MPASTSAASFADSLLDLLAPSRCPGCDLALLGGPALCGPCAVLLEPAGAAGAAFRYAGPLRDALVRLKYEGRRDLAPALAALLAEHVLGAGAEVDCVVPMPLHADRLSARGYNQVALLAAPLARALGVPLALRRVARRRPTAPQVGLDPGARRQNVRGAFVARPDPRRPRVLLVDDVRTTGATLEAAERALLEAGASIVVSVALAASERHDDR